jgi:Protein of unknown function (DUF1566)
LEGLIGELLRSLASPAVLVIDHGLGLVWEVPGSSLPVSHQLAKGRAAGLSRARFAGFQDWHLPNIDEATSLTYLLREDHPSVFDELPQTIWSADEIGVDGLCIRLSDFVIQRYNAYYGDPAAPRTVCVASLDWRVTRNRGVREE